MSRHSLHRQHLQVFSIVLPILLHYLVECFNIVSRKNKWLPTSVIRHKKWVNWISSLQNNIENISSLHMRTSKNRIYIHHSHRIFLTIFQLTGHSIPSIMNILREPLNFNNNRVSTFISYSKSHSIVRILLPLNNCPISDNRKKKFILKIKWLRITLLRCLFMSQCSLLRQMNHIYYKLHNQKSKFIKSMRLKPSLLFNKNSNNRVPN